MLFDIPAGSLNARQIVKLSRAAQTKTVECDALSHAFMVAQNSDVSIYSISLGERSFASLRMTVSTGVILSEAKDLSGWTKPLHYMLNQSVLI